MRNAIQKIKNFYHLLAAVSANIIHRSPGTKLKVIGVTGTDGKTTTTHLIYHILKTAGRKVSMISSVYAKVGGREFDTGFHVTTPDVFDLTRYLKKSLKAEDEYFVLETTSHALDQNRIFGIDFTVGVLTNITHEHLDYHGNFENYVKTKAKLLYSCKIALTNKDDQSYSLVNQILKNKNLKPFTYSLKEKSDFRINIAKKLRLPLSSFNNYNYLASYGAAMLLGIEKEQIFSALKSFILPPGRMEVVWNKDFKVIIDFAHTPNAIHLALQTIKNQYTAAKSRVIHVFGSAAKRDVSKRPFMGKASGEFSDIVILTEEDYRDEDPKKICREIAVGLEAKNFTYIEASKIQNAKNKHYTVIIDRFEAIKAAIRLAKYGDAIVTTGKAHEKSLCRGDKEYPWDEKNAVLEAVNSRDNF